MSKYLKYRSDPIWNTLGIKYSGLKKLLRLHAGKVPVIRINTWNYELWNYQLMNYDRIIKRITLINTAL